MNDDAKNAPAFVPPVSAFIGPIGELIAQRMLNPPSHPGLLAGLNQYEILRVLGGGGMGIVLLAREAVTGREVAIKMVKSEIGHEPKRRSPFSQRSRPPETAPAHKRRACGGNFRPRGRSVFRDAVF